MNYNVFYSAKARDDLADIYLYVAYQLLEPVVAQRLYESIVSAVHTLEIFPCRNALYDNEPWKSLGLRKLHVKNYIVFYTVNEERKSVNTIRIMYGARDIENQLSES